MRERGGGGEREREKGEWGVGGGGAGSRSQFLLYMKHRKSRNVAFRSSTPFVRTVSR